MKVAILISGRGSNMVSLIEQAKHYNVVKVFSNKVEAAGLNYAKAKQIDTAVIDRKDFTSLKDAKAKLFSELKILNPDLILLAGFMQIISEEMVNFFYPRIINIHPSLLPAYPGVDTHQRILQANEKQHSCTVHLVDSGVDTGPIIAQAKIDVLKDDTPESLASRLLKQEHLIYPWVVNNIANGNILINSNGIRYKKNIKGTDFLLNSEGKYED